MFLLFGALSSGAVRSDFLKAMTHFQCFSDSARPYLWIILFPNQLTGIVFVCQRWVEVCRSIQEKDGGRGDLQIQLCHYQNVVHIIKISKKWFLGHCSMLIDQQLLGRGRDWHWGSSFQAPHSTSIRAVQSWSIKYIDTSHSISLEEGKREGKRARVRKEEKERGRREKKKKPCWSLVLALEELSIPKCKSFERIRKERAVYFVNW